MAIVDGALPNGTPVRLAIGPSDTDRAQVLRRLPDGQWRCGCFAARWSVARTCAHELAAHAAAR